MEADELKIKKMELLMELEKLKQYGIYTSRNYTINDNYEKIYQEFHYLDEVYRKRKMEYLIKEITISSLLIMEHIKEKYPEVITITKEHIEKFIKEKANINS